MDRLDRDGAQSKPAELDLHEKLEQVLIPLHEWNHRDRKGVARGKSPRDANWPTVDCAGFDARAYMASGRNVGVRLRDTDLVIDVDPRHFAPGDDPLGRLCADVGLDPLDCPQVMTGGGGRHLYLTKPADRHLVTKLDGYPGIEIKTIGAQVVAAGSVHPDTARCYEWLFLCAEVIPQAPEILLRLAAKKLPQSAAWPSGGEHTPSEVAEMLSRLDPRSFRDYPAFLELMMAAHHATAGAAKPEFLEWAAGDPEYAGDEHIQENAAKWDRLKVGGIVRAVTHKTLHMLVRNAAPRSVGAHDADKSLERAGDPAFTMRNGQVQNTLRNTMAALRSADLGLAHDDLAQRPVLTAQRLPWRVDVGRELNEDVIRVLRHWIMERFGWEPSKENVTEASMTLAFEGRFNPVCDYLAKLEWDGIERLDVLLPAYFGARDGEYERAVGRKLMIAAVRRVRTPGAKFDTMPILEGRQGSGKTTALRILGGEWHSDAELGSVNNKDAPITLQGTWLMELGELTAMSKSEVDHLKAFVSRTEDRLRPPYERSARTFKRRCVFVGTTNATAYLRDLTGNRRFLPVQTGRIDLAALTRHRDQLWAEAAAAEATGEVLELSAELWPQAAERQSERTLDDPWSIKLAEYLSGSNAPDRISSTQLLEDVIQVPCGRQNQHETKRLRQAMESIGWQYRRSVRIGGRVTVGYISPAGVASDGETQNLFG